MYKITFEIVNLRELWRFSNADPNQYKNTTQTVPNSQIPEEYWNKNLVISESTDPWDQYNQLKSWEAADKEFVRNVKLFHMESDPVWKEVLD